MRTLHLIFVLTVAIALSGCAYQLRGTGQAETSFNPADYLIKVRGANPNMSHILSIAMRERGFRVAGGEYDLLVTASDEDFELDELSPDTTGAVTFRAKAYALEYSFRAAQRGPPLKQGAVEVSIDETELSFGETISDTREAEQLAELRMQAARKIVDKLVFFVESEEIVTR